MIEIGDLVRVAERKNQIYFTQRVWKRKKNLWTVLEVDIYNELNPSEKWAIIHNGQQDCLMPQKRLEKI
jgi:hypothetical protein